MQIVSQLHKTRTSWQDDVDFLARSWQDYLARMTRNVRSASCLLFFKYDIHTQATSQRDVAEFLNLSQNNARLGTVFQRFKKYAPTVVHVGLQLGPVSQWLQSLSWSSTT